MKQTIAAYMRAQKMPAPPAKILVAVSGGIDSVVLLDVLVRLGFQCVVAHCNFHLRGDDSDGDAQFVEALAQKYEIPLRRADFDTKKVAAERKISIEMAARDLRYTWFEQVRQEEECAATAIAHNANDSAETMLLNMARGTGIDGLRGIPAVNGDIVRPLLCVTRETIENYAERHALQHRFDATNDNTKIRRNFVRHKLMPLFEQINPAFVVTMRSNAQNMVDVATIYHEHIAQVGREICQTDQNGCIEIDTAQLLRQSAPRTILFELLKPYQVKSDMADAIFDSLGRISGKTFNTPSHRLLVNRGKVVIAAQGRASTSIYQIQRNKAEITSPIHLKIDHFDYTLPRLEESPNIAYFDADKVKFPLMLRRWQMGDSFFPLGMMGRKKVSDLFVDCKLSRFDKENAWILTSGGKIIWVVGLRIDNRFCLTKSTKKTLKLTYYR